MRKIFLHIDTSVDGFIEDETGEIDWHFGDEQFDAYINEVLSSVDGMIFGRVTHELLAGYWPTAADSPEASPLQRDTAKMMNALPKYVVSGGGYSSEWANSHVIGMDLAAELGALKRAPGRNLALFAGAATVQSLMRLGLVDEYRLILNPLLMGGGTSLFESAAPRTPLELLNVRRFDSGALVLSYRPR